VDGKEPTLFVGSSDYTEETTNAPGPGENTKEKSKGGEKGWFGGIFGSDKEEKSGEDEEMAKKENTS
jgi:hypothetical protein